MIHIITAIHTHLKHSSVTDLQEVFNSLKYEKHARDFELTNLNNFTVN